MSETAQKIDLLPMTVKQTPKRRAPSTAFKPGQSGNPNGRPRADAEYREAMRFLKEHSPAIMRKAVEMAMKGSEKVTIALVNKICPETLKLSADNPLVLLLGRVTEQVIKHDDED